MVSRGTPAVCIKRKLRSSARPPSLFCAINRSNASRLSAPAESETSQVSAEGSSPSTSCFQTFS